MTTWASDLRLGPYELVTPIGTGGMGEVWKARDTRLGRFVAVKRLLGPSPPRFEIEARIARLPHLAHPACSEWRYDHVRSDCGASSPGAHV